MWIHMAPIMTKMAQKAKPFSEIVAFLQCLTDKGLDN
jgi:hypothetical protein